MGGINRAGVTPAQLAAVQREANANAQVDSSQNERLGSLEAPTIKGRLLDGFRWYKAFRINNVANDKDSPGEGTSVIFEITGQSDFGNTANMQTSRIFASFGVRGGEIMPVFTVNGGRPLGPGGPSMGFQVYLNDDGYYWLYIRTAVYSVSQISYFVANYSPGVSDPFLPTDTIHHDGTDWVVPKPTGAGTLYWDYNTASAFQPFVVGKGYTLTSTDNAGLMIAGYGGDFAVTANVPTRFNTERVVDDVTGRRQSDHSYLPLSSALGNMALGVGLYHYSLNILVASGQAGARFQAFPQRGNHAAPYAHKAFLRGGSEHLTFTGTIRLNQGEALWFDLTCDQDMLIENNTMLTVSRGYGQ